MARHPDTHLLGMPLARHRLEGRLCFLQAYCSKLLRLQSRVDATLEQARRILPRLPGSAEVHVGITAQHQAFFLAGKTIFPAPGSKAGLRHKEIEAMGIGELVVLLRRLGFPALQIGQHPVPPTLKTDAPIMPPNQSRFYENICDTMR